MFSMSRREFCSSTTIRPNRNNKNNKKNHHQKKNHQKKNHSHQ